MKIRLIAMLITLLCMAAGLSFCALAVSVIGHIHNEAGLVGLLIVILSGLTYGIYAIVLERITSSKTLSEEADKALRRWKKNDS